MDALGMLINGFAQAVSPINLLMAAIGTVVGTLVGVLPGLGPPSAIAILLPMTTFLGPTQGIIMLAGIYYGAQYGGSTTAILLNIPGEGSNVPTCLDGYPLAKKGRGGPALGIAAISSFAAGMLGIFGLVFFAPIFADQALKFGPPEYFALMLLSLTIIVNFSGESMVKGLTMGFVGYLLAMVGFGISSSLPRLNLGITFLSDGFDMVSIVIGLFAISEVLKGLEEEQAVISSGQIGSIYPTKKDLKKCSGSILRGGVIGFLLGLLPGCSPSIATFITYDVERKVSKHPEEFGHGAIEGVAGPEAANNANSQAGFIPLFAFGIPGSAALAVLLAGLMIYGLQPGPMLFKQDGSFVWTVIASMVIGNAMLLILNLPLVGIWVKITQIPYGILGPVIMVLCVVGAYTSRNSLFDVVVSLVFGVISYLLQKYRFPLVPLTLCFILSPMLERSFLQSMAMGDDSPLIFFQRPIAIVLLAITVVLLFVSMKIVKSTKKISEGVSGIDVDITN